MSPKRGQQKLHYTEVSDVRLERSKANHNQSIHCYFEVSMKLNHHHPIFLPYLPVSDIIWHILFFLLIHSFIHSVFLHYSLTHSLIDWWIIDCHKGNPCWFFAFIDSISSFVDKEYCYRFWWFGINEWMVGEKERSSNSSNNIHSNNNNNSSCSKQWTKLSTKWFNQ